MSFNAAENVQSQIPALQMLVALGFKPLSQADALSLRGGRPRNVVLDDVLAETLMRINRFCHRGREYAFDLEDAHEAMRRLKPTPDRLKGLRGTNQDIFDSLVLGTTITKSIDGDSKSYSFRFIDWENPSNNAFHVTAEFSVERTGSSQTRRCDIVAFVNGIPVLVIENKRPTETLKKADSQLIGYQSEDNIPQLFHFAQLLMTMNRVEARYATVGTPRKFWSTWRDEEDTDEAISASANRPLTGPELNAVFSGDFALARAYFASMAAESDRSVTEQDRSIFALCRPERLLDIIRRFTVFDGGVRKVARHQQFFGIRRAVETVKQFDAKGARKGGVIWHTQGSGKSLTMVMLGRALALEKSIPELRRLMVGSQAIEYVITRRERKTLEIAVEPDASVSVAAPLDASIGAIEIRLRRRAAWIMRQQRYFLQFLPRTPERLFISGETHLYLGRQYRLKVVPHVQAGVKLTRGFIVVQTHRPNSTEVTRELVDAWYRERAHVKFAERTEHNLGRFPDPEAFRPRGLIVRQIKQRWGSMSPAGRLLLNRRLIEAPVDAIDYVITHELCHIAEPNHGAAFYDLLDRILPDWQHRKQRLERIMA